MEEENKDLENFFSDFMKHFKQAVQMVSASDIVYNGRNKSWRISSARLYEKVSESIVEQQCKMVHHKEVFN